MDVPYFLSKYDPDALRFYLTATAPETRDTEFSWEDFVERNNNELVATWGNLGNRMLSFAYKRFDGKVPEPGPLDDEDRALLAKVEAGFETVGALYDACKFRAALGEALAPKALTTCGPRGQRLHIRCAQCRPGPQGALVPDQGGPAGCGDGVRDAERARRG
ncbi:MAG: class I tRNA ligase family protein [Anaerolineae bacterium]|nr:class I tRNA ligase family protein [Anaerolineae bacterium]